MATRRRAKTTKGMTPKTFKGLSKKRMDKKGGGPTLYMPDEETRAIQFRTTPREFTEGERHVFQEEGAWRFVPCVGDDCPLCLHESDKVRRTSYYFLADVYSFADKQMKILEGGNKLAKSIHHRFKRNEGRFLRNTYDVTSMKGPPRTVQFELGEEDPVPRDRLKPMDHGEYLDDQLKRYYGDDLEAAAKSSLDDDDDYEDDEDYFDEDEDLDEDLEDEDDDDEDEDDEPPRRRRSSTKSKSSSRSTSSGRRRRR